MLWNASQLINKHTGQGKKSTPKVKIGIHPSVKTYDDIVFRNNITKYKFAGCYLEFGDFII